MNKLIMVVLGATLVLASCSKDNSSIVPTVNQEALVKKGPQSRPFGGSMTFSFAPNTNLPCDCGDYFPVGTFEGTGNLTHLGNSYSQIKPCVSPIYQDGNYVGDHVGVECAFFVAANGDTVNCYTHPYDMYFSPVGAIGIATVDFVGGTGRFANVSGSFTGTVTVGQNGASFTNLSGNIVY